MPCRKWVTALELFSAARPRLFGIAYRMLGSALDADDLLQEVWLRWQDYDHAEVRNPAAFLATITTRLAINAGKTARARHETYIGPWLPEPVDTSADPQLGAERDAALEVAVLVLLEKLTPTERAAYVLREAFDYPYPQIAEIVQTSEAAARQLVSRARKHLAQERTTTVSTEEQRRLLTAFIAAAKNGDLAALEELLAEDVVSYADSNGKVRGASKVRLLGRSAVAKVVQTASPVFWAGAEATITPVNGRLAAVVTRGGVPFCVINMVASDDGIDQLMWMMNTDKILQNRHFTLSM
ncbi:RNA polymerase sigma24 factor [Lentzea aerocolonigenes]|uniref:RNA polymerase sigma24 factor n=1 Tax=Lentzea aerocolonigenes TaxID=68170 RepID=A0A0F0GD78_LENAE|nr:RNA polymerase sigma24 factor [Lentzea aerocolonigenes]